MIENNQAVNTNQEENAEFKINLLKDVKVTLLGHKKSLDDIDYIGCPQGYITKNDFEKIADIEISLLENRPQVAIDLVLVGKGFCLIRDPYDENWIYVDFQAIQRSEKRIRNPIITVPQFVNEGGQADNLPFVTIEELNTPCNR